ncbi:MAG: alpha-glucan family phosphorylase, partial [Candidatus Marinimicrobia bacterium]|nr:alpha-glucan family phosphorylase [Candidatus Neomarinimicrobiota bacterium]
MSLKTHFDFPTCKTAYFSAEIGLSDDIPTFSGGLGVLAGDHVKAAADQELPFCAVTLLYKQGYFVQNLLADGTQVENYPVFEYEQELTQLPVRVKLPLEEEVVHVAAWLVIVEGVSGGKVPVIYLDTDLPENSPTARKITRRLYAGGKPCRIMQEAVLGFGGMRMLEKLGAAGIKTYHMNEGHTAFLTLELLRKYHDLDEVKKRCIFTTHTPIAAGHDVFEEQEVQRILGSLLSNGSAFEDGRLNMTRLALKSSRAANGVSRLHSQVSSAMFPEHKIGYITNGVHHLTWTSEATQALFDEFLSGWRTDPDQLLEADAIPIADLMAAHNHNKSQMLATINAKYGEEFEVDKLTICFARRAASYKRAGLLLSDLDRLSSICAGRVQVLFAGKAHPLDDAGKAIIKSIVSAADKLRGKVAVAYLEGYNMRLGNLLTSGADIWLNNPERPKEASGTSGMKAALNGALNLSVSDGWWAEGGQHGTNGWTIDSLEGHYEQDADNLYTLLENDVIPTYCNNSSKWGQMMKASIRTAAGFTSHRMVKEYSDK